MIRGNCTECEETERLTCWKMVDRDALEDVVVDDIEEVVSFVVSGWVHRALS